MLVADDDWAVASTPTCTSVNVTTEPENYFKSVKNDLNLDCVSNRDLKTVYIYGLANETDTNILGGDDNVIAFKFKVTGFTSPNANYGSTNYTWRLYIMRFGTRNYIRHFSG
jgi:hypothetical protein|mmetsp:Transcript_26686/g.4745  ORF Transcript_26686/g.4745 Transcript_26686/m.4745 type:complete len:112 (+) Transcript_26686:564-899(+)